MTYSSSISIGRKRFARRHQNAVSMAEASKTVGPISNTIILVVLACLIGLLYLTQVTKTNATGYRINELQNQYEQLEKEHGQLELSAARLQSIDRVSKSDVSKELVSVSPTSVIE